jgi:hypothetical protein
LKPKNRRVKVLNSVGGRLLPAGVSKKLIREWLG